jgi:GxxExxY protein
MTKTVYKNDLIHPELSYRIIGSAFEVFNEIGGGHKENIYQKGMNISFKNCQLNFKEQVYYPVTFKNNILGKNFFDFLIGEKIIVEIKSLSRFTKAHFDQVLRYLQVSKLQLALLITFGQEEVKYKRVVNFHLTSQPLINSSH